MHQGKTQLIALLIAAVMLNLLFPLTVFATDTQNASSFAELQAAVSSVSDGDTILITDDIAFEDDLIINGSKSLTIISNDAYTLDCSTYHIRIESGTSVTMQGSLTVTGSNKSTILIDEGGYFELLSGNVYNTNAYELPLGKNLFDAQYEPGTINATGEPVSGAGYRSKNYTALSAGVTYVFSRVTSDYELAFRFYDSKYTYLGDLGLFGFTGNPDLAANDSRRVVFTPNQNMFLRLSSSQLTGNEQMQIEIASVPTSYDPFVPNSPSPDFPSEIRSAGGGKLRSRGKNICPTDVSEWESGDYNISTGLKSINGQRVRVKELISCLPSTQYYRSTHLDNHQIIISTYNQSGQFVRNIGASTTPFTTAANEYFISVAMETTESTYTFDNWAALFESNSIKPFICLNSEADKTYEAYKGVSEITLPILRKIRDVTDTLEYLGDGQWKHTQRIGKKAFDGSDSELWVTVISQTGGNNYYSDTDCAFFYELEEKQSGNTGVILSEHFRYHPDNLWNKNFGTEGICEITNDNRIFIRIGHKHTGINNEDTYLTAVPKFKAYLAAQYAAGTPVTVYYQLETPIETILSLGDLSTYAGKTIIEQDVKTKAGMTIIAPVGEALTPQEQSGHTLTFEDTRDGTMAAAIIEGYSEQTVTVQGKNLFDRGAATSDFYVRHEDGGLAESTVGNSASSNINISGLKHITISGNTYTQTATTAVGLAFYDKSRAYLSGVQFSNVTGNGTYVIPEGAKYVRYTFNERDTQNQLEDTKNFLLSGPSPTAYEPYIPNEEGYAINVSGSFGVSGGSISGLCGINVQSGGDVSICGGEIGGSIKGINCTGGSVNIAVSDQITLANSIYLVDKAVLTELPEAVSVMAGKTKTVALTGADSGVVYIVNADLTDAELNASIQDNIVTISPASSTTPGEYSVAVTAIQGAAGFTLTIPVTVQPLPSIGGTVSISGTPVFGETLTANLDAITYTPDTDEDVPNFAWKRGGEDIHGADSATYTLVQDDIGAQITVSVSADGVHALGTITSAATAAVEKADAAAPVTPVLSSKAATAVTLIPAAGYEYTCVEDGAAVTTGTWQDSSEFTGLESRTKYDFYQRIKETATHKASAVSDKLSVTTSTPVLTGAAAITGTAVFGQTLSATLTGSNNTGTLHYQWIRNGIDIPSATGMAYMLTQADIGTQISVRISSSVETGAIVGAPTATVQKAGAAAPLAPTLLSKGQTGVTLAPVAGYEYICVAQGASVSGGTWQDSSVFTALANYTTYDFYQRIKETGTHKASAASDKITVTTDAASVRTPVPVRTPAPTAAPTPPADTAETAALTPAPTTTPVAAPSTTPTQNTGIGGRAITGTLLSSDGNPMAGYVMELHSQPLTTVTDKDGRYAFYDVDYTCHKLIVKAPEGQKIAEFGLSFTQGAEFGTNVTQKSVNITYTSTTETISIEVKLMPDQTGAAISQVITDKPQPGVSTALLWIGGAMLAAALTAIIILLRKKRSDL